MFVVLLQIRCLEDVTLSLISQSIPTFIPGMTDLIYGWSSSMQEVKALFVRIKSHGLNCSTLSGYLTLR